MGIFLNLNTIFKTKGWGILIGIEFRLKTFVFSTSFVFFFCLRLPWEFGLVLAVCKCRRWKIGMVVWRTYPSYVRHTTYVCIYVWNTFMITFLHFKLYSKDLGLEFWENMLFTLILSEKHCFIVLKTPQWGKIGFYFDH